jgi:predicted Zn-dependent peptidase
LNSTYPANEVEKERGVIMEEIRMYQDNPMMGLASDFVRFLYKDSKIGCWNISGEVEDIIKVNRNELVNYHKKYFNPKEIVLVASGNVDESLEEIFKDYFGNFINGESQVLPKVEIRLNQNHDLIINKEIEQGHFCIGVPAISWTDKRKYALRLLDIILSGNTSSRLYTRIREEKAWAYYVFPITDCFKETGFVGVQSGVKLDKLKEAEEIVINEMLSLADTVTKDDLKRAKEYLFGKIQLATDRTDFISNYIGEKLLLENRLDTIQTEINRYSKVELKELKDLSRDIFIKDEIRSLSVCR